MKCNAIWLEKKKETVNKIQIEKEKISLNNTQLFETNVQCDLFIYFIRIFNFDLSNNVPNVNRNKVIKSEQHMKVDFWSLRIIYD